MNRDYGVSQKAPRERVLHLTRNDFVRQTFRCGGKGGQNVNKVETGVRFIHEPSGARGESCEERTQGQNERIAFRRMAEHPKMRMWIAERHADIEKGATVEQEVAKLMASDNLLVEVKDESGRWVSE